MKGVNKFSCLIITSLALNIVIIVLWIGNVFRFSVVDAGTYISVCVAVLSILVTLVLGWQIFNWIEMNAKLKVVEEYEKKLKDEVNLLHIKGKILNKKIDYVDALTECAFLLTNKNTPKTERFLSLLSCICTCMDMGNIDEMDDVSVDKEYVNVLKDNKIDFENLNFCLGELSKIKIADVKEKKEFYEIDKKIRSLGNYGIIKGQYEDIIDKIRR